MEEKRLYRSRKERVLGGVCGGLAEYFHADPSVVRLLFALGALLHGIGVIVYLVLWLVTPEAPARQSADLPAPTADAAVSQQDPRQE